MKEKDLKNLFETDLRYLYNTEIQISKILPKILKNTDSDKVGQFVEENIKENKKHVDRVKKSFDILGTKLGGKKSLGITGLIDECTEIMEKMKKSDEVVYDVSLLASLQRINHYQIGAYETLSNYSKIFNSTKINELLNKTLVEEKDLIRKLKKVINGLTKIKP